jgi:hypothetical protein
MLHMLHLFSEACCNSMFRVFQRYVSSVFSGSMLQLCLSRCCICFTHMLHVFYSDVAYGCNGFQACFRCVFQVFRKHVSSVSTVFRHMVQPYFYVLKVDRVLHLSSSHLLLHRLSRSRQDIYANEGWAMGAGRGSSVRTDAASGARWALGQRGLRTSRLGARGRRRVVTWGVVSALSCCADVIQFT